MGDVGRSPDVLSRTVGVVASVDLRQSAGAAHASAEGDKENFIAMLGQRGRL